LREPNTRVSLVDAAMPGMLPVINEECVRQAGWGQGSAEREDQSALGVRTARTISIRIRRRATRSSVQSPIVGEGEVVVELDAATSVTVGIERLHLEQDAGKSLHDQSPTMSYVDLKPVRRCPDGDRFQARHPMPSRPRPM